MARHTIFMCMCNRTKRIIECTMCLQNLEILLVVSDGSSEILFGAGPFITVYDTSAQCSLRTRLVAFSSLFLSLPPPPLPPSCPISPPSPFLPSRSPPLSFISLLSPSKVLTLEGVARLFQSRWATLAGLNGFARAWTTFLEAIKTCACSQSSEVGNVWSNSYTPPSFNWVQYIENRLWFVYSAVDGPVHIYCDCAMLFIYFPLFS